jgi:spermidine synthase
MTRAAQPAAPGGSVTALDTDSPGGESAPAAGAGRRLGAAPSAALVASLLLGSGMCALIYQTAWQRMFQLVFGATTAASSAVLGVFLGGLGAGALFFGGRVARTPRPLVYYGLLELGIALTAAISPALVELSSRVYIASGGSTALGTAGATLLRLALAACVMGAPAFLMGGTLPAAARAVETEQDRGRTRLGLLYGLNTMGAVLGALLGTFALFETLGTRQSLWAAALVNVLVALVARARGRSAPPVPIDDDGETAPSALVEPGSGARALGVRAATGLALAVASGGGFAFLLLELVWYRMLAPILGGSTFTFGLILALALGGIGLGGYLYSRRPEARTASPLELALVSAALALGVAAPFAACDTLAIYAALTRDLGGLGFAGLLSSWAAVAGVVVLPAAILSGYQFPLLFALLGSGRRRVSTDIGRLYAFNTVGSIGGALLGGFVLLPLAGAPRCWQLAALIYALTALAALGVAVREASRVEDARRRLGAGALGTLGLAALALAALAATGPSAVFRHSPIGAGRVNLHGLDENELTAWRRRQSDAIVWERDGVEAAVAVTSENSYNFIVNGKVDGSVFWDRGTQAMLGLLPALLHDEPRSAFVVGLGTGMTAGWLAAVPGMEQVEVAELEPMIDEVARMAAALNQDAMNRPNLRVRHGDGRELLLTSDRRFDLIASEPSNPYRAGISSLFTREFYEVVRSRLAPGGVFSQWIQGYEIDARSIRMVARTLRAVFPSVELWQTEGQDLLFLASDAERTLSVSRLRERIATEPYRTALRRFWLVEDVEGVLSHFLAPPGVVEQMSLHLDPPVNVDDQNLLEYAFARSVGTNTPSPVPHIIEYARALGRNRPRLDAPVDFARVDELLPRAWLISGSSPPRLVLPPAARARADAVSAACFGVVEKVLERWQAQPRAEPADELETYALALGHASLGRATPFIDQLAERGYLAEAHLARGRVAQHASDHARAVAEYAQGLDDVRGGQIPLCNSTALLLSGLGSVGAASQQLARQALGVLEAGPLLVGLGESERRASIERLAFSLMRAPAADPWQCVRALGQHLTAPLWNEPLLVGRFECLQRAGHPLAGQAEAELVDYLAAGPGELLPPAPPSPPDDAADGP